MRCISAVEVDLPNGAGLVRPRLTLQCTKEVEAGAEPGSHAGACAAGEVSITWRHDPAAWAVEPQVDRAESAGVACGTCGRATFPHPYRHPIT